MTDDATPPADEPQLIIPDLPSMHTHVYEELPPKTDNRGLTVVERRTIDGIEPRGFIRFLGRVTILLPVPNPNHPQGFSEMPQQVTAPIDAKDWREAFTKAEAVLQDASEKTAKRHFELLRGQAGGRIQVARTVPQVKRG